MLWKGSGSLRTATLTQRSWQRVMFKIAIFVCCVVGFTVLSHTFALAQTREAVQNVATVATKAGMNSSSDLYVIIGRVIYVFLSVLGLVLLGYLLYAGFLWTTAGDNAEKVEQARRMIYNAIVGLFIIAASFAITAFVLARLSEISTESETDDTTIDRRITFPRAAGSLGRLIEYHLPMRDAIDVPRNTSIIVTFTEPINIASLIDGYRDNNTPSILTDDPLPRATALNVGTFHIIKRDGTREEMLRSNQVDVHFTPDRKTFVFRPREWLGNSSSSTRYRVEITYDGLLREDHQRAFTPDASDGYKWQFEVSTRVDLTPPKITSIVPGGGVQPPNVVIQINFNEAVDPTSASGIFRGGDGFSNIQVQSSPSGSTTPLAHVAGEWRISNRYQTVEFIADAVCGHNACGREIRCLPHNATPATSPILTTITLLARAANLLSPASPQARFVETGSGGALYDGIVDVCNNSLDGNENDTAQGPPTDNKEITFQTNGNVNLTAPLISSIEPVYGGADYPVGSSNVPVNHEPKASFGPRTAEIPLVNILQASTVNAANVYMTLQNEPPESALDSFWFTSYQVLDQPTAGSDGVVPPPTFGSIAISHRPYAHLPRVALPGSVSPIVPVYAPIITSGVQNLLQNCFKPSGSTSCSATLGSSASPPSPSCCDDRPGSAACSFSHRTP